MQTDDVGRPTAFGGDDVDVEIGRIGGKHRARFGDRPKPREQFLLDVHLFEDGFDDQIAGRQRREIRGRRQPRQPFGLDSFSQTAGLDRTIVEARDARATGVDRGVRTLHHRHLAAGVEEGNRNACPHRPRANDADRVELTRLNTREVRHARDLPLGEEGVTQGARLRRRHQFEKHRPLAGKPLADRQRRGHGDRLGGAHRRNLPARLDRDRGNGLVERGLVVGRNRQVRRAAQRLADQRARILSGGGAQIALGDHIGETELERLGGTDLPRAGDHVERRQHAGQPRRALGAAGARQHAEVHFRQADFGVARHDATMAAQRQLEATTECGAMDRGHHRLRPLLDDLDDVGQERLERRLAEFADVGPGDESAPLTGNDHGRDRIVGERGSHRRQQAGTDRLR